MRRIVLLLMLCIAAASRFAEGAEVSPVRHKQVQHHE
jgi:hypothetical protein